MSSFNSYNSASFSSLSAFAFHSCTYSLELFRLNFWKRRLLFYCLKWITKHKIFTNLYRYPSNSIFFKWFHNLYRMEAACNKAVADHRAKFIEHKKLEAKLKSGLEIYLSWNVYVNIWCYIQWSFMWPIFVHSHVDVSHPFNQIVSFVEFI